MQSRIFTNGKGIGVMREIRVEVHGKGGELGISNIKHLMGLLEELKTQKTPQEVNDHFMLCMGYCLCCKNSGFIDEKGADEIMQLASFLAGIETERAEKERKA